MENDCPTSICWLTELKKSLGGNFHKRFEAFTIRKLTSFLINLCKISDRLEIIFRLGELKS